MRLLSFVLPTFSALNRHIFEALRLSALPVATTIGLWELLLRMLPSAGDSFFNIAGMLLATLLGYCLAYAWFATRWHRFLLLSEPQESVLPAADQGVLAYGARLFLLVTALSAFGLAAAAVLGAFLSDGASLTVNLMVLTFIYWLFFRLSPVLTTTALGSAITRREAWLATRGTAQACLGLGLMFVALAVLAVEMSAPHELAHPPLQAVFVWAVFWVMVLLHATAVTVVHDRPASPA